LITFFLTIYDLAWRCAIPFLKRADRISIGWEQRTLLKTKKGPYDLWIQAASGGESMLTNMILDEFPRCFPSDTSLRVLVSSGTKQGVDSLNKWKEKANAGSNSSTSFKVDVTYFPLDAPHIMKRAFTRFAPRLAIVVETELWPGYLYEAKRNRVPVLLINGRMSEKSFGSYKHLRFFFTKYGPDRILAISELDRSRFETVLEKQVEVVNNLKFDRIKADEIQGRENPVQDILPEEKPFVLLGSIRREEEQIIAETVKSLLTKNPEIVIGLFPKHIERADTWIELLAGLGIEARKRSETKNKTKSRVLVWDVFGELAGAYALAKATFVGGSLVNLGGQNFLEPLVFGLRPIIGPYWKNFAWVGREIITSGLVIEVESQEQLTQTLLTCLAQEDDREQIIKQVHNYFDPKKGGTVQTCQIITEQLKTIAS